ncbi:MAG: transposase [Ignavibacteria bacterium]|nr:transposase [Ignavibacteria bacterium]
MDEHTKPRGLEWLMKQPQSTQTAIIQDLLELGRIVANGVMQQEVSSLAGERYTHEKPHDGRYSRHGTNPGSIQIGNQRLPIEVPRVRDTSNEECIRLQSYAELHKADQPGEELLNAIALGVGTRNYRSIVETTADAFGLSKSRVSTLVVEQTAAAYKHLQERSLSERTFVALMIDGKTFQREQIIVALGYDLDGVGHVLDMIQTSTENARAVGDMLRKLVRRGMKHGTGMLVVSDGGKGIIAAMKSVFAGMHVHQRCRFHKAENVASYLPEAIQAEWKMRLFTIWKIDDYNEARAQLQQCVDQLSLINLSAANSLREGFEQTLTLQRIGMNKLFARSLGTTNRIENLNRQMARLTRNVTNWCTTDQRLRWASFAALTAERRMNKLHNHKHVKNLANSISEFLRKSKRSKTS